MTRQIKTPKQRAEEDLATANRKVVALNRSTDRLRTELATKGRELAEAIALRDFLKQHPALEANPVVTNLHRTTDKENQK